MGIVYQHRRKDTNEVFYVGIGKSKERAFSSRGRNSYWRNVVKKVGYEVDILIEGINWSIACEIERGLIKAIGRADIGAGPLVNMTDGGEGTVNPSPAVREKNKLFHLGNKSRVGKLHSQETKLKQSKARIGKYGEGNNPRAVPIKQIDKKTKEVLNYYSCATEASKITGVDNFNIRGVCVGRLKTAGGFIWENITKEEYKKYRLKNNE